MSNSTSHPKYSAVAPKVKNNGWDPIPVKPVSKVPAVAGFVEADETTRQSWQDEYADCGTGIRLGGKSNLIAVDSDTPEKATANAVRTVLHRLLDEIEGDGVRMERIGNAPKFLVPLHCSTSQRKRVVAFTRDGERCAVEILGEGQYFVASGIHPDTGNKYVWPGKPNPIDATVSELPEVTADWIDTFIEHCIEALELIGWTATEGHAPLNGDLPAPPAGLDLDDGYCKAIVEYALLPKAKGGCGVADGGREPLRDLLFGVVERLGVSGAVRDWLKPLFESDQHTGWEAYFDSQWDDAKTRSSDGACGVTFATVLKYKFDDPQRFDAWCKPLRMNAEREHHAAIDSLSTTLTEAKGQDWQDIVDKVDGNDRVEALIEAIANDWRLPVSTRTKFRKLIQDLQKILGQKPTHGSRLDSQLAGTKPEDTRSVETDEDYATLDSELQERYLMSATNGRRLYDLREGVEVDREAIDGVYQKRMPKQSSVVPGLNRGIGGMTPLRQYHGVTYEIDGQAVVTDGGRLLVNEFKPSSFPHSAKKFSPKTDNVDALVQEYVQRHMLLLADGDKAAAQHLLAWHANLRQFPHDRARWFVGLFSTVEGLGKSFAGERLMPAVLGEQQIQVRDPSVVSGRFTEWAANPVLLTRIEEPETGTHGMKGCCISVYPVRLVSRCFAYIGTVFPQCHPCADYREMSLGTRTGEPAKRMLA